jgi:actin cytoskeleton-regulatory complex protein SLA1
MTYLSLVKAAYDYAAQSDDELTITEDSLYFVLDNSDSDWTKVRIKSDQEEEPAGLVPAAYLEVVEPISTAKALYDYEATGEGELGIREDEPLKVYENEDEWWLVQSALPDGRLGLVPGNYVEEVVRSSICGTDVYFHLTCYVVQLRSHCFACSSQSSGSPFFHLWRSNPVLEYDFQRARPTSVYVDPEERVAALSHEKLKADEIKTWGVTVCFCSMYIDLTRL